MTKSKATLTLFWSKFCNLACDVSKWEAPNEHEHYY